MSRRTQMLTAAALVSVVAVGCSSMQSGSTQKKMTAEEAIAAVRS